jgi:hypothetical protein
MTKVDDLRDGVDVTELGPAILELDDAIKALAARIDALEAKPPGVDTTDLMSLQDLVQIFKDAVGPDVKVVAVE